MSHRRAPSLLLLIASTLLAGCGHAKPLAPATPGPAATAASVATREAANGPSDVIRRSAIRGVLAAGLGAFLQKVSVDDHPVFSAGKFHGFRITALEAESFRGVDLQPGDVVTLIDGMPIEHPEEAIAAFNALEVASSSVSTTSATACPGRSATGSWTMTRRPPLRRQPLQSRASRPTQGICWPPSGRPPV